MFRIMIVDDEPVIRKGLINFIPWDVLDCEVVYLAKDGLDAKDNMEKYKPDIVLTDIKMPEIDGIELSRLIHEKYPGVKTIMLTAYSDFSYAQSAIKYGVIDFVLKPTSTEELVEAINKVKSSIEQERKNIDKIKFLEDRLSTYNNEMVESFILKIINSVETEQYKIIDKAKSLGINLHNYVVAVIEMEDLKHQNDMNKKGHLGKISSLKSFVSTVLNGVSHYTAAVNSSRICTVIDFEDDTYGESMQYIINMCSEIVNITKSLMTDQIHIGISRIKHEITHLYEAYNEGLSALSDKFYIDKNIFVYTGYGRTVDSSITDGINMRFEGIIQKLQSGKYDKAAKDLSELFEIHIKASQPIENIKNMALLLYSCIITHMPGSIMETNHISASKCIMNSTSIDDIYNILLDAINKASKAVFTPCSSNTLIDKINTYIEQHYSENINLMSIAKFVHLNASYLSRFYKKETNETLTEKITKIRIEKARELLLNTDLKIYEISLRVGIENANYFSALFKKYTSLYPKDYRALHLGN